MVHATVVVLEDAQVRHLLTQRRRQIGRITRGNADQQQQPSIDLAHNGIVDRYRCLGHALHQNPQTCPSRYDTSLMRVAIVATAIAAPPSCSPPLARSPRCPYPSISARKAGNGDRYRRGRPRPAAHPPMRAAQHPHRSDRRARGQREFQPHRARIAVPPRAGAHRSLCRFWGYRVDTPRYAPPDRFVSRKSIIARSSGIVTLRLDRAPSMIATAWPSDSSSSASSVNCIPGACVRENACSSNDLRYAWGVWAACNDVRSMVRTTMLPSTSLIVSVTGTAVIAAPCTSAANAAASNIAAVASGRAASWITAISGDVFNADRPAMTESWRRGPPVQTAIDWAGKPVRSASSIASRLCAPATTTISDTTLAASAAATLQQSSGLPAASASTLSLFPKRSPRPAATITTPANRFSVVMSALQRRQARRIRPSKLAPCPGHARPGSRGHDNRSRRSQSASAAQPWLSAGLVAGHHTPRTRLPYREAHAVSAGEEWQESLPPKMDEPAPATRRASPANPPPVPA